MLTWIILSGDNCFYFKSKTTSEVWSQHIIDNSTSTADHIAKLKLFVVGFKRQKFLLLQRLKTFYQGRRWGTFSSPSMSTTCLACPRMRIYMCWLFEFYLNSPQKDKNQPQQRWLDHKLRLPCLLNSAQKDKNQPPQRWLDHKPSQQVLLRSRGGAEWVFQSIFNIWF